MSMRHRRGIIVLAAIGGLLGAARGVVAATFTVDSTADEVDAQPGDGVCQAASGCTLRAAVNESNALPGPDRIVIPAGHYAIGIPDSGSDEDGGLVGDFDLYDEVEIDGAGADVVTIEGNDHDRVFQVFRASAVIRGVTIAHGYGNVYAGGILVVGGDALVTDSVIRDCGGGLAGATFNYHSTMRIERTTVTNCHGVNGFGGLLVREGSLAVVDSTIANNDGGATGNGGGVAVFEEGSLEVERSTVNGNLGGRGGGLYVDGLGSQIAVVSSTVSGNQSNGHGGGIYVGPQAKATLANVTITGNVADANGDGDGDGGGLWAAAATSQVSMKNSIVAGNTDVAGAAPDCHGGIVATGPVLIEQPDCTIGGGATGHLLGVPAGLAPLAANGGPTATHALTAGSPARDAGDPAGCTDAGGAPLPTDQRGVGVLATGRCDLGAFEVVPSCPPADPDADGDGIPDTCDNCPIFPNPDQTGAAVCIVTPYDGLDTAAEDQFDDGLEDFAEIETPASGLGPVFNGSSCAECHNRPVIGGSSPRTVTRFGRISAGVFDPLVSEGGSLIQANGIDTPTCSVPAETVPVDANVVAHRDTPPLFGLGLVDLVPDSRIRKLAHPEGRGRDHISGRAAALGDRVGRFGWKSQIATLAEFAADAYANEMGITSPTHPADVPPQGVASPCDPAPDPEDDGSGVAALTDFMTLLAPLPVSPKTQLIAEGRHTFQRLRCQSCHTDKLRTATSPIAALSHRRVPMFSDLLLHDMGPGLADGIEQGDASGSEFRTAPLWGIAESAPYLHDGRAATIEDAILAHGGEATPARDRFAALSSTARKALTAFLRSL